MLYPVGKAQENSVKCVVGGQGRYIYFTILKAEFVFFLLIKRLQKPYECAYTN